jgi:POT family proton-dependent oligopeptide transporter
MDSSDSSNEKMDSIVMDKDEEGDEKTAPLDSGPPTPTVNAKEDDEGRGCCCCRSTSPDAVRATRPCKMLRHVFRTFRHFPKAFWLLCVCYMFTSYAYFAMALQMTTFYVQTLHQEDTVAATLYGAYGFMAAVWTTLMGPLGDILSTKGVFVISILLGLIGRVFAWFVSTGDRFLVGTSILPTWTIYVSILTFVALGDGAVATLANTLLGKLVKPRGDQRKVAFGVLYSFQNVGAMLAGFGLDITTLIVSQSNTASALMDTSQWVILTTAVCMLVAVIFALTIPSPDQTPVIPMYQTVYEAIENGTIEKEKNPLTLPDADETASDELMKQGKCARCGHTMATLATCSFWRFAAFSLCCVGVKMVFRQLDMTFPIYMKRVFGPDAPVGSMYAIDPLLIIILAPLAQVLTANLSPMHWIILGTWITAFSPLFLAFSTPSMLHLYGVVLFGIMLAVGESLWSPRLNDYAVEVAGKARMGIYLAATAPIMFVSKFPAGWLSGWLIARYCPSDPTHGSCDTVALWGIISLVTLASSPLLLTLLRSFIYEPRVRQQWEKARVSKHLKKLLQNNGSKVTFASSSSSSSSTSSSANGASNSASSHDNAGNAFEMDTMEPPSPPQRAPTRNRFDVSWNDETDTINRIMKRSASNTDVTR